VLQMFKSQKPLNFRGSTQDDDVVPCFHSVWSRPLPLDVLRSSVASISNSLPRPSRYMTRGRRRGKRALTSGLILSLLVYLSTIMSKFFRPRINFGSLIITIMIFLLHLSFWLESNPMETNEVRVFSLPHPAPTCCRHLLKIEII
jgi:hypothetical protein